jgi:hypothetical protein
MACMVTLSAPNAHICSLSREFLNNFFTCRRIKIDGVKSGHGRYVFANGDEYVGEWENGAMSGRGRKVIAATGAVFHDGLWANGLPIGDDGVLIEVGRFCRKKKGKQQNRENSWRLARVHFIRTPFFCCVLV